MGTVTQYNLANVRDSLGGGNPVYMSNFFRGGPYVPTTATTTVNEGPIYAIDSSSFRYTTNFNTTYIFWGGTQVGSVYTEVTSFSSGGITYYRGAYVGATSFGLNRHYYISRQYQSSTSINTGVPSSGSLSISQLYGARNP